MPDLPDTHDPDTDNALLCLRVDPTDVRVLQGPYLRIDLVGCDCGTCQSQPFVQISDGDRLLSFLLSREAAEALTGDPRSFLYLTPTHVVGEA
jgi:hypothetical protein